MPEHAHEGDPIRVPDHDLDDLVATVSRLVADSRKQGETLALLADDHSSSPDAELNEPPRNGDTAVSPSSTDGSPNPQEGKPASIFILALAGTAYAKELAGLENWVNHLLLPVYGREITTSRPWCGQWQEHPEAVARLHALWLAWQQLTDTHAGLTGPSTWHRDHLDPTILQLRTPEGPFTACTTNPTRPHHRLLAPPEPAGI
jgi:hypothetical protein